jgi:hypothetical protein
MNQYHEAVKIAEAAEAAAAAKTDAAVWVVIEAKRALAEAMKAVSVADAVHDKAFIEMKAAWAARTNGRQTI